MLSLLSKILDEAMDFCRSSSTPTSSNEMSDHPQPFRLPSQILVTVTAWLSPKTQANGQNCAHLPCSRPPPPMSGIRPQIILPTASSHHEEQNAGDQWLIRARMESHTPTRASSDEPLSAVIFGHLLEIRATAPGGIASSIPGEPLPPLSAVQTAAVRSPQPPQSQQPSSTSSRRSPSIRAAAPVETASPTFGATSPPISAPALAADCPSEFPHPLLPSAGSSQRMAQGPDTGPPCTDFTCPGGSSCIGPAAQISVAGDRSSPLSHDSSFEKPLFATPEASLAAGFHPLGRPIASCPSSGQFTAGRVPTLFCSLNGEELTGQPSKASQQSTVQIKSVNFRNPISSVASIAASSTSTPFPASTPQSLYATATSFRPRRFLPRRPLNIYHLRSTLTLLLPLRLELHFIQLCLTPISIIIQLLLRQCLFAKVS